MENVKNVDNIPDYIMSFIRNNEESIRKIIVEEKHNRGDGIIYIDTHVEDERMDLVYLTYEEAKQNLELSDELLVNTIIEGKDVIIINDNEYKTRFILYL
mgnify:CR=1 FL=1|tara:strand:- start:549 stop:848 length:300 start_codon:yes stop_codon:yes gene_type:complete